MSPCLIARDADRAGRDRARHVSHPQAIAQCARFLRERLPRARIEAASSTAEAVRIVAMSDQPWAALGTRRAAELYGACVLAEAVEDEPGNATRFVWLAREAGPPDPSRPSKTSLAFWGAGDDEPRLARALPVGVRLPRREPHEDRVAAAARGARPLPLLRRLRGRRAARASPPRRSRAFASTASRCGSSGPTRRR